ncbi:hypothetical protein Mgra_00004948, partial [Meloidogyne graminicola]
KLIHIFTKCVLIIKRNKTRISGEENTFFKNIVNSSMQQELTKFNKLIVTPESFEKIKNIHENLYYGGIKALIGQLGKIHYKQIKNEEERLILAKCLDKIENRYDLVSPAKCLIQSRERNLKYFLKEKEEDEAKNNEITVTFGGIKVLQKLPSKRLEKLRKSEFKNFTKHPHMLSRILIPLAQMRLQKYGLYKRRLKRSINEENLKTMDIEQMKYIRKELSKTEENTKEKFRIRSTNVVSPLTNGREDNLASKISNLLIKSFDGQKSKNSDIRWSKVHKTLQRISEQIERGKKFPGSLLYEKRMYDIVLERRNPSLSPLERRSPLGLLQKGINMIDSFSGIKTNKNKSETNNVRLFSPRFMPLAPDKGGPLNQKSLLSPTLFAMYEENDNQSFGNIPQILRKVGVPEKYRQSIISKLMEITGTIDHIEKALNLLKKVDFFDEDVGHPLMKATDKILNSFFSLEDSLDKRQREEFKNKGFTFGKKNQLLKIYKDNAMEGQNTLPESELERFEKYEKMNDSEKENALWETVRELAKGKAFSLVNASINSEQQQYNHLRSKRFTTSVFTPIILSPFQFAPFFGLTVFGPVILSPSTFSPYILSPSVFSPLILSPLVFSPLILSPSVASPWIITPGVGNPYILSPYVFGPFILGPLVLHPFILSPYVLSPNILNPYVLSPIILNPIALSPDILSPQVLGGAILSPAILSPAIFTQTYFMVCKLKIVSNIRKICASILFIFQ